MIAGLGAHVAVLRVPPEHPRVGRHRARSVPAAGRRTAEGQHALCRAGGRPAEGCAVHPGRRLGRRGRVRRCPGRFRRGNGRGGCRQLGGGTGSGAGSGAGGGSCVEPAGTSPARSVVPISRTGNTRATSAESPSSVTRAGAARDEVSTEPRVCRTQAAASDRGLRGCTERPGEQGRRGRLGGRRGILGPGSVGGFGDGRRRFRSGTLGAGALPVGTGPLVREHPADRWPEPVGVRRAHGQPAPRPSFDVHEPGRGHAGIEEEQCCCGLGTQHVGTADRVAGPVTGRRHSRLGHDCGRSTSGVDSVHTPNVLPGHARPGDLYTPLRDPLVAATVRVGFAACLELVLAGVSP